MLFKSFLILIYNYIYLDDALASIIILFSSFTGLGCLSNSTLLECDSQSLGEIFNLFFILSEEGLLTLSMSPILIKYSKDREKSFTIDKPLIPNNMSPWFITGFSDAEACFDFNILKSKTTTTGFSVIPRFRITAHKRDIILLYMIKEYFGCGSIGKIDAKDCLDYTVADQRSIFNIIIPFFNKYSLIQYK